MYVNFEDLLFTTLQKGEQYLTFQQSFTVFKVFAVVVLIVVLVGLDFGLH